MASEIAAASTRARAIFIPYTLAPALNGIAESGNRTRLCIDLRGPYPYAPRFNFGPGSLVMKVKSSLKSLKTRHRACRVVRRKGRVYVINKVDPRYKAKQG